LLLRQSADLLGLDELRFGRVLTRLGLLHLFHLVHTTLQLRLALLDGVVECGVLLELVLWLWLNHRLSQGLRLQAGTQLLLLVNFEFPQAFFSFLLLVAVLTALDLKGVH